MIEIDKEKSWKYSYGGIILAVVGGIVRHILHSGTPSLLDVQFVRIELFDQYMFALPLNVIGCIWLYKKYLRDKHGAFYNTLFGSNPDHDCRKMLNLYLNGAVFYFAVRGLNWLFEKVNINFAVSDIMMGSILAYSCCLHLTWAMETNNFGKALKVFTFVLLMYIIINFHAYSTLFDIVHTSTGLVSGLLASDYIYHQKKVLFEI